MESKEREFLELKLKDYIAKKRAYEILIESTRKKLYPEKFKKYTAKEEEEMRYAFVLNERQRLRAMMQELDKEEELPF
jgi:hypothetical protein